MYTRVTSKTVAERAGVSQTTVSFVLNGDPDGNVSQETKKKVLKVMRELGYRPNLIARSMRTQSTRTIGIITISIASGWFTQIVLGAEKELSKQGYQILLGSVRDDMENTKSLVQNIDLLLSRQVEGLIIITSSKTQNPKALEDLTNFGLPIVLVNYYSSVELPFQQVFMNYRQAGKVAVEHFSSLGLKRIAYIGGPIKDEQTSSFTREIYCGFKEQITALDLPYERPLIHIRSVETGEFFSWGKQAAENLLNLSKPPEAIYCLNDYVAFGVLAKLKELQICVPDDIAVIGNDNINAAKYVHPSLTSVDMMLGECGENAAKALLNQVGGKKVESPIVGSVRLIKRASTTGNIDTELD